MAFETHNLNNYTWNNVHIVDVLCNSRKTIRRALGWTSWMCIFWEGESKSSSISFSTSKLWLSLESLTFCQFLSTYWPRGYEATPSVHTLGNSTCWLSFFSVAVSFHCLVVYTILYVCISAKSKYNFKIIMHFRYGLEIIIEKSITALLLESFLVSKRWWEDFSELNRIKFT